MYFDYLTVIVCLAAGHADLLKWRWIEMSLFSFFRVLFPHRHNSIRSGSNNYHCHRNLGGQANHLATARDGAAIFYRPA